MQARVRSDWSNAQNAFRDMKRDAKIDLPPAGWSYYVTCIDKWGRVANLFVAEWLVSVAWLNVLSGGFKKGSIVQMSINTLSYDSGIPE